MRLATEFYKLPIRFDPVRLSEEVLQFTEAEWRPHPQGHPGNTAIPLISVNGGLNDEVRGRMKPTPYLERCPYLQQVLESLGTVLGRARLMRIAGESDAKAHVDASYYWRHHVRVHIPAVTYPEVQFLCGDKAVNMAAGETWIFDSWKMHNVINPIATPRIHLVADTVGSAHFWRDLVGRAELPEASDEKSAVQPFFVPYVPGKKASLRLETRNFPIVMTPWEQESLATSMIADVQPQASPPIPVLERTRILHFEWHALWTEFGDSPAGWDSFKEAMHEYNSDIEQWKKRFPLLNGMDLVEALRNAIVRPALNPELATSEPVLPLVTDIRSEPVSVPRTTGRTPSTSEEVLRRPVFVVSAPRSGSTMLFELLARSPGFVTIGGESHRLIEGLPKLSPVTRNFESNRLTESDADARTIEELRGRFYANLRTSDGARAPFDRGMRMLEKTPKNALRIPFIRAVFPDARFIYLYRSPEENISSILEAWRSGKFVTYPNLPGWGEPKWSMALISGWRELVGKRTVEVATRQWMDINAQIMSDLESVPRADWCMISYNDVIADPQGAAARLWDFADVPSSAPLTAPLPLSRFTLTRPAPGKWRKNEGEISSCLGFAEQVAGQAKRLLATASVIPPDSISTSGTERELVQTT
jgi:hypothetical protein